MNKVLYTVDAYLDIEKESWFDRVSKKRNQWYADRCGATYRNIEIPKIIRKPAHYHKLDAFLDFLASDFDRGILIDMDIYFEDACPDMWEEFPYGVAMCFDYLMLIETNYRPWCEHAHAGEPQPSLTYFGPTNHAQPIDGPGQKLRYFNTGVTIFDRAYAQFMVDRILPKSREEDVDFYKDGWGEQHEFNYHLDVHRYPVVDLPRDYNEMTGLTKSRGQFISHYAAPWGRFEMSQREVHENEESFLSKYATGNEGSDYIICNSLDEILSSTIKDSGWKIAIPKDPEGLKRALAPDYEFLTEESIAGEKTGVVIVSKEMRKRCRDAQELIFTVQGR